MARNGSGSGGNGSGSGPVNGSVRGWFGKGGAVRGDGAMPTGGANLGNRSARVAVGGTMPAGSTGEQTFHAKQEGIPKEYAGGTSQSFRPRAGGSGSVGPRKG